MRFRNDADLISGWHKIEGKEVLPTWQLGRRGRQECVGLDPDSRRRPPVDPDYPSEPHSIYKNDELKGPDDDESERTSTLQCFGSWIWILAFWQLRIQSQVFDAQNY